MKKPTITVTVTEASRNFADCVNRAHYQNTTFVLLKNGEPFARLIPDSPKTCRGPDARDLLAFVAALAERPAAERRAALRRLIDGVARLVRTLHDRRLSHRDLKAARRKLKVPVNKWR